MAEYRSYEIQTFVNGDWKIQAFFDDKDLALLEARRMIQSKRYSALRVTEEYWDPNSETFRARTIYRENDVDRHNQQVAQQRAEVKKEAEQARQKRENRREQARKAKEDKTPFSQTYLGMTLIAIAIFVGGVGAIALLNFLAQAG